MLGLVERRSDEHVQEHTPKTLGQHENQPIIVRHNIRYRIPTGRNNDGSAGQVGWTNIHRRRRRGHGKMVGSKDSWEGQTSSLGDNSIPSVRIANAAPV
jgi:hypothetical protein